MGWCFGKQRSSGIQSSDKLPKSIYGTQHVSSFGWLLSRIEMSLRFPCTSPIKTTPPSLISLLFVENTLSKQVCHPCQRSIRSTPASFDLIRSLFSSVSNFFRSLCFFFHLSFPLFFRNNLYCFLCPSSVLNPSVLGYVPTCRQCLVRQVTSRSSVMGQVMKKCTRRVIKIQTI